MTSSVSISPKQTWLTVFLPALLYYTIYSPSTTPILSYLNLQPSYTSLNTTINLQKGAKHEIFYEGSNFETVIEDDFASFFDMVWVEDAELGRGYLLLSDSASSGKVWRFETGGGLVPIGKSLYLDQSGCRSSHWVSCDSINDNGSRGISLQVDKDSEQFTGKLLIVEGGEKRIVRLEEDGARTPLILDVPSVCNKTNIRLSRPAKITYTPFGDLLFTETVECYDETDKESTELSAIYRLKEIVNVPPISFRQSRAAHTWTIEDLIQHNPDAKSSVELSYKGFSFISEVLVGKDLTSLFVAGSVLRSDGSYRTIIVKMTDDSDAAPKQLNDAAIFFDMSDFYGFQDIGDGIAMTMDSVGHLYATFPGGIAIIDSVSGDLLTTIKVAMQNDKETIHPNSIIIGKDGYLYMASKTMLLRWKTKSSVMDYPTNLIVPKRKS